MDPPGPERPARNAQRFATAAERATVGAGRIRPQPAAPMKRKIIPRETPTEAQIQHAAYLLWLEEGRPEGRDLEHWLAAKEMLTHRHGRDASTRHRAIELPAAAAETLN
jgi:hypothetical protein